MSEEQIKSTEELNQTPVETIEAEEKFAKSGKKSKKHLEEVKAEEERKARAEEHKQEALEEKPKGAKPVTRPVLERRGKKYQAAYKNIDKTKAYSLTDAIKLAVETNPAKFDAKLTKTFAPPSFFQTAMVRLFVSPSSLQKMNVKKLRLPVLTSPKMPNSSSNLKRESSISTFSFLPQLTCQNLVSSLACSVLKV